MGVAEATAQVEKKCYKNQTAGWLGVVKLDHLGAQVGHSIEPYGTAYLSDEEAILTSRAPKDPKDNPFVEQTFQFQDEKGSRVEQGMRPLILIEDDREVPGDDRYVPGHPDSPSAPPAHDVNLHDVAAGQRDTEAALGSEDDRSVATEPSKPVLVPSSSAAVPPSQARATPPSSLDHSAPAEREEDVRASWVEAPDRTEEPQQGSLQGSNEPAPGPSDEDAAKTGSPTGAPPQQPVNQQVASSVEETTGEHGEPNASESSGTGKANGGAIEQGDGAQAAQAEQDAGSPRGGEEHAAHTAGGEETGAADSPVGDPPEGEFAAHEEVGSP